VRLDTLGQVKVVANASQRQVSAVGGIYNTTHQIPHHQSECSCSLFESLRDYQLARPRSMPPGRWQHQIEYFLRENRPIRFPPFLPCLTTESILMCRSLTAEATQSGTRVTNTARMAIHALVTPIRCGKGHHGTICLFQSWLIQVNSRGGHDGPQRARPRHDVLSV
jgi:hypothetical protein